MLQKMNINISLTVISILVSSPLTQWLILSERVTDESCLGFFLGFFTHSTHYSNVDKLLHCLQRFVLS